MAPMSFLTKKMACLHHFLKAPDISTTRIFTHLQPGKGSRLWKAPGGKKDLGMPYGIHGMIPMVCPYIIEKKNIQKSTKCKFWV